MKTQIFKSHYFMNTVGLNAVITFPNTHHKLQSQYCVAVGSTTFQHHWAKWHLKMETFYDQDKQRYWMYRPRGRCWRPQMCRDRRKDRHGWRRQWHARFPLFCLLLYYHPGPSYLILVTNEDNHVVITAIIPVNKVAVVEGSMLDGKM